MTTSERTNVLLLFTDQQRFDTIHALGNPVIRTPNLDRLCREGVAFTSAYTPCPVCVPARACMHYGRHPCAIGCCDNPDAYPETASFMQILTEAGYRTHGIGKCHFKPDRDALRGFQSREVQEEAPAVGDQQDYMQFLRKAGYDSQIEPSGVRGELYYIPQLSSLPQEVHPTQWVGERSVAFIEENRDAAAPWFLFSSYIHPHPPFSPPSPWHKLYRADLMPDPVIPEDWEFLQTPINRAQNRYKIRDDGWNRHLARCIKAYYYACISFVDYQVGRILQALESTGQLDNTLILFAADHGELLGDCRCFGKRSMHDGSMRIPLLARLPDRFEGGLRCDTPASLIDIAPTIFGAADIPLASMPLDGEDLKRLADGSSSRDTVFAQWQRGKKSIYTAVDQKWKYTYSAGDDREYLFDRVRDPLERRSVAAHPHHRKTLLRLRRETQEWVRRNAIREITELALDGERWISYADSNPLADPNAGKILQDPEGYEALLPSMYRSVD